MNTYEHVMPLKEAEMLREMFCKSDFSKVVQRVENKYDDWKNEDLPEPGETYTAEFSRSVDLENSTAVWRFVNDWIVPKLKDYQIKRIDLKAYRLDEGGHFRTHLDDTISKVSFVYYLSKNWKWDWGGLLLAVDDAAKVVLPKYNSMVVMSGIPHLVTRVEAHAKEPRYMLAGFCK